MTNNNYMNVSFSVKCLNCKAVSDTFDPFLDIPLEIKVIFLPWDSVCKCVRILSKQSKWMYDWWTMFLLMQTALSVSKALEQFVKPEQLDGENAYKCTK